MHRGGHPSAGSDVAHQREGGRPTSRDGAAEGARGERRPLRLAESGQQRGPEWLGDAIVNRAAQELEVARVRRRDQRAHLGRLMYGVFARDQLRQHRAAFAGRHGLVRVSKNYVEGGGNRQPDEIERVERADQHQSAQ